MAGVRIHAQLRQLGILVALLLTSIATSAGASETIWPTAGWQSSKPEQQGVRSDLLADMLENIRRKEIRIDSVSIVRNGHLVLDAYFHSQREGRRHAIYSVTKSVMSALIGIAIDKGYIAGVDVPVLSFFPEMAGADMVDRKRAMTLAHLLTMTTGLRCRDSYRHGYAGYMEMQQSADWTRFVLGLPMEALPGERFEYCNGASFLLSAVLAKATNTDVLAFARRHLFAPLKITDVSWSSDNGNVRNGCCGLSLTPHDMAKLGWLFLNRGAWNGRQIISPAWVDRSTGRHIDTSVHDHFHDYYGYQWWGDARGYYMAVGYNGQRIIVVPPKNMVVVYTGSLQHSSFYAPEMLLEKFIIPAAASDAPLSPNVQQQERLAALIETLAQVGEP